MPPGIKISTMEELSDKIDSEIWVRSWGRTLHNLGRGKTGNEMYQLMLQIKQNKERLHAKQNHLIQRKKQYFMQAQRPVVEMWHVRILSALQREEHWRVNQYGSIEKYVTCKKGQNVRREKETTFIVHPSSTNRPSYFSH